MAAEKCHHVLTTSETIETEHVWKFYNLLTLVKRENNENQKEASETSYILSKTFSFCAPKMHFLKWQMKFYPNGFEKGKLKFSLFLTCLNAKVSKLTIPLEWEFTARSNKKQYPPRKISHIFSQEESSWGFFDFIDRNNLINDLKMGDDMLEIVCKVSLDYQKTTNHLNNFSKNVGSLLLNMDKFCDVILEASNGVEFKAHKAILSCRSKVFSAMFENNMKEKLENVVKIDDVNGDTLKYMLNFIYTGKLIHREHVKFKELFIAAEKYDLNDLKEICCEFFIDNINIDNTLDLYEFAKSYNIYGLKLKLAEYFSKHKQEIVSTKGLKYLKILSRSTIEDLLYITATNMTTIPPDFD